MGRHRLPDPDDVLAGLAYADLDQLIGLIHQVNPTDRGRSARETEHRYRQKSALQDLLIRQHGEELDVVEDTDEAIVLLRLRSSGRDACHARVEELDEYARLWVRRRLARDEAPGGERRPDAIPERRADVRRDAVDLGVAALADWDYAAAEEHFRHGLRGARAVLAARHLAELYVDYLADDEAALGLAAELPVSIRQDRQLRTHLAVAMARAAPLHEAQSYLAALGTGAALESWAELGRRATRAADRELARAATRALRERDAGHPAIVELEDALASLRADERRPLEERVEAAFHAERFEEAEELVAELLARWPRSPTGRATKRKLDARRRDADAERKRELVRRAVDKGDLRVARRALAEASELAPDHPSLPELAEAIDAAEARVAIAATRTALDRDLREGLVLWTRLTTEQRSLLADHASAEVLGWLEALGGQRGHVDAVIALHRARHVSDAEQIAALLLAHRKTLRRLPQARVLYDEAEAELERRAVTRSGAALDAVEAALLEQDVAAARRALPSGEEVHAQHREAWAALRELVAEAELHARIDALVDEVPTRAMALAREAGLHDRADALSAELHRAWRHLELEGGPPPTDHWLLLETPLTKHWIGGDVVVLASCHHCELVLRVASLDTLELRRTTALRLPEPFELSWYEVDGDDVWLSSRHAQVLRIGLSDGRVRGWWPTPPTVDGGIFDYTFVAPGRRYLWSVHPLMNYLYDLEAWPQVSEGPRGTPIPVVGTREPLVAVVHREEGADLHRPFGGRPSRRLLAGQDLGVLHLVGSPDGRRFCGLADASLRGELVAPIRAAGAPAGMVVAFFTCTSRRPSDMKAIGADPRWASGVVRDPGGSGVWIHCGTAGEANVGQVALASGRMVGPPDQLVKLPAPSTLVGDLSGEGMCVLARGLEGPVRVGLERELPSDERLQWAKEVERHANWFSGSLGCNLFQADAEPGALLMMEDLRQEGDLIAEVQRRARTEADPERMYLLAVVAASLGLALAEDLLASIAMDHPDHPRGRLLNTHEHVARGRWSQAEAVLAGIDSSRFGAAALQHVSHVRALLALHQGDLDAAERHLGEARRSKICQLDGLRAWVAVLRGRPCPPGDPYGIEARLHHGYSAHLQRIVAWEQATAEGDHERALAVLDVAPAWGWTDLQTAARRAWTALELNEDGEVGELRRRVALGHYLRVRWKRGYREQVHLPLAALQWGEARLDELAERVAGVLG